MVYRKRKALLNLRLSPHLTQLPEEYPMLIPELRRYSLPLARNKIQQIWICRTGALFQHRNVTNQVCAPDPISCGYISSSVPTVCLFVQFLPVFILITKLLQFTEAMYTDIVLSFTSLHRLFQLEDPEYNEDLHSKYSPSDRRRPEYPAASS